MHITCTLTGRTLKADGNLFASVNINTVHPIFQLNTKQLARLAQVQHMNKEESQALFLALFLQLESVHIAGKLVLPFPRELEQLPDLFMSKVVDLLPYVNRYHEDIGFPQFSVCAENLGAIPAYLQIIQDFKDYGRHIPKILAGDSIELEEKLETARQLAKAASIRRQQDRLTLGTVIEWACSVLQLSELRAKLFRQAMSKQGIGTDILQDLLGECLERLPERLEHDAIKKQWLVDRMNALIVEKLQLLEAIGVDITDNTDYLNNMHSAYSINVGNESRPNTATITGQLLASTPQVTSAPLPQLPRLTSAPVREDYTNAILYMAALRRWNTQTPE